jgi:hypothetical protein
MEAGLVDSQKGDNSKAELEQRAAGFCRKAVMLGVSRRSQSMNACSFGRDPYANWNFEAVHLCLEPPLGNKHKIRQVQNTACGSHLQARGQSVFKVGACLRLGLPNPDAHKGGVS